MPYEDVHKRLISIESDDVPRIMIMYVDAALGSLMPHCLEAVCSGVACNAVSLDQRALMLLLIIVGKHASLCMRACKHAIIDAT